MNRIYSSCFKEKDRISFVRVFYCRLSGFGRYGRNHTDVRKPGSRSGGNRDSFFPIPMADGVVIQQSSTQALKNGMTLPVLLEQLTSIRSRG